MEELQQCQSERDEAVLKQNTLEQTIKDLESVSQSNAHAKEEKARHLKLMEVQCTTLGCQVTKNVSCLSVHSLGELETMDVSKKLISHS